jgi:hypothetical protein
MKTHLLSFVALVLSFSGQAQGVLTPFEEWSTTSGTQHMFHKNITKLDGSRNTYVAGGTVTGAGDYDILVTKTNPNGVLLWTQQYSGSANYHDMATDLYIDGSGNVYITGFVVNDTVGLFSDIITIKYNSSGVQQWVATKDGSGGFYDAGTGVIEDGSGNVYVCGSAYNSGPNTDFMAIKYNSSGTQQWATQYNGASGMDDAAARIGIQSGQLGLLGLSQTAATSYQPLTLRLSLAAGAFISATYASTYSSNTDLANDVVKDGSNNFYIVGGTPVTGCGYDFSTIKLSPMGALLWQTNYNGADSLDDVANAVRVDLSGNVYVTGYTTTSTGKKDIMTVKYNSSGVQQWIDTYNDTLNGNDEGKGIVLDASLNVYVTGYDSTAIDHTDYYTIKYNNSGTEIWNKRADGDAHLDDKALHIAIDTLGDVVVSGQSRRLDGNLEYKTIKYIQKTIIIPTDNNSQSPQAGFNYFQNKGQLIATDSSAIPDVKYYARSSEPMLYFKNNSYSMVFTQADTTSAADTLHRIDVSYTQVNPKAKTYPLDEQEYFNNFYMGYIPTPVTQVHANKRLVTPDLYTNIDVEYSSNQNGFKYYFIVKPGAVPSTVKMEYAGATSFNLNGTTNELTVNSTVGSITYARPQAYQVNSSNVISAVTGWTPDWQTNGASNKYKFNTGAYDSTKVLVIVVSGKSHSTSPASSTDGICWSTYLGGTSEDYAKAVDVDINGVTFVGGTTFSPVGALPITTGVYLGSPQGGYDGFLFKFKANHSLHWGTYVGGSQNDNLSDVKVRNDGNGDPYVVGSTPSSDLFPIPKTGAHNDASLSGAEDGFIGQFHFNTGAGKWVTYFGTAGADQAYSLDFDGLNRMYVGGKVGSATGITSAVPSGAYSQSYIGGYDAFLARFTSSDNYDWYTPYGGSALEYVLSVKVDHLDNVVIYGETSSANLPTTNPAGSGDYYDNSLGGGSDIFVAKFSSAGAVQWATYIGGGNFEGAGNNAIAFNLNNDIYLGGVTWSSDFPVENSGGFFKGTFTGPEQAFFMKISGSTYDTILSTFLTGGNYANDSKVNAISVNKDDEVYIGGTTTDTAFVVQQNGTFYYQDTLSGNHFMGSHVPDAFLFTIDQFDDQIQGTYFGGYELGYQEQISDLVTFKDALFAVGQTNSSDTNGIKRFPLFDSGSGAYYDSTYNGNIYDGFVTMFCIGSIVGIEELTEATNQSFLVYPNPSSGELNIKMDKYFDENSSLEIYSIEGKLVYSYILPKRQAVARVDVGNLSDGLYVVRIRNSLFNGTVKFSKY